MSATKNEKLYGGHTLESLRTSAKVEAKSWTAQIVDGDVFCDLLGAAEECERLRVALDTEQAAHARIGTILSNAGVDAPDGTSTGMATKAAKAISTLRTENERLRKACEGLLRSSDAVWYEQNAGHDFRQAADTARSALEETKL